MIDWLSPDFYFSSHSRIFHSFKGLWVTIPDEEYALNQYQAHTL